MFPLRKSKSPVVHPLAARSRRTLPGCQDCLDQVPIPEIDAASIPAVFLVESLCLFLLEKDANEMSHRWQKLAIIFNWKFSGDQFIYSTGNSKGSIHYTTGNSKGSIKTHALFIKDFPKIGSYFSHPGDSIPQVGGHLTLERVTFSPSQKGHGLTHLDLGIFRISQLGYPTKLVNG